MEEYSFNDFKKDIIESCLETTFEYDGKFFSLSIEPRRHKLFRKKQDNPLWVCYNETDNLEIIRSKQETICDEIIIDGFKLVDIWDKVII